MPTYRKKLIEVNIPLQAINTKDTEETVLLETELIREWKPKTNLKMNPDKPE